MADIHPDIIAFWQTEPDRKASDLELRELEAKIGAPLPESYKRYHQTIGYKRTYFKNEKYKWGEIEAGIGVAYDMGVQAVEQTIVFAYYYSIEGALKAQNDYANPMALANDIGPRIPSQMLTIGSALGKTTGQVLLNLSEKNHGNVWYWERVDATWGTNGNKKIGYLGQDVFDVLTKLVPFEGSS